MKPRLRVVHHAGADAVDLARLAPSGTSGPVRPRPLVSMLTTAGVIFLRTGASDGVPLDGGATGDVSASAARPAVVAARPNAIAANTRLIIR